MVEAFPESKTKRAFLKSLLIFMGGVVGILSSWAVSRFVFFRTETSKTRELSMETFDSLVPGSPSFVPQVEAWVVKGTNPADSFALNDRCTHLGCRYKWNGEKNLFECPCHGSSFDLNGSVLQGPATKPLLKMSLVQDSPEILRMKEQHASK